MAKYVLTRPIIGKEKQPVGTEVELTKAQAESPLYRNRVRIKDGQVELTPAIDKDAKKPGTQASGRGR